jgi:hypothetical protein
MKKSTSLILGILATLVWIAMIVVLVVSFQWLTTAIQSIDSSPTGYVGIVLFWLFGWVFWMISAIYTVLYVIGIPHYFLYLYDKHKSAYIYLVKYLSAIPLAIIGFILLVLITNYMSDPSSIPLEWFSMALLAIPFAAILLFVHVPTQKIIRAR